MKYIAVAPGLRRRLVAVAGLFAFHAAAYGFSIWCVVEIMVHYAAPQNLWIFTGITLACAVGLMWVWYVLRNITEEVSAGKSGLLRWTLCGNGPEVLDWDQPGVTVFKLRQDRLKYRCCLIVGGFTAVVMLLIVEAFLYVALASLFTQLLNPVLAILSVAGTMALLVSLVFALSVVLKRLRRLTGGFIRWMIEGPAASKQDTGERQG